MVVIPSCTRLRVVIQKVFLDFISYSGGPLPEDLLSTIKVPVMIGWGDQDPWEPIESGRVYADYDSVEVRGTRNTMMYILFST